MKKLKKLSAKRRLEVALNLLNSDICEVADMHVHLSKDQSKVTKMERDMNALLSKLYRLIHLSGTCKNPHLDWEEKNIAMWNAICEEKNKKTGVTNEQDATP